MTTSIFFATCGVEGYGAGVEGYDVGDGIDSEGYGTLCEHYMVLRQEFSPQLQRTIGCLIIGYDEEGGEREYDMVIVVLMSGGLCRNCSYGKLRVKLAWILEYPPHTTLLMSTSNK